jgi:proline iminopeptidase
LWDYLAPVAGMIDDLVSVYRYDQRACGRSSGGPPYTIDTAVEDLEALRSSWQLPQWIVAGHSWGATLALAYAVTYPQRVRALMYLSGTGVDASWHEEYRRNQAERLSPQEAEQMADLEAQRSRLSGAAFAVVDRAYCELLWSTDFAQPRQAREFVRSLFIEGIQPNYEVNELLGKDADRFAESPTLPARLAALPVRTLVLQGEADPRPARGARDLARRLPAAEFVLLPGRGHLPWLEQPDQFKQVLRAFLTCL